MLNAITNVRRDGVRGGISSLASCTVPGGWVPFQIQRDSGESKQTLKEFKGAWVRNSRFKE